MTPDFAEFLRATPVPDRTGRVFPLRGLSGATLANNLEWVSGVVSAIGKAAGVKVDTDPKTGAVKFASAHDLRRAFGARWATRVMPTVLQQLMRHEDINTTLEFYVGKDAETTADVVWEAFAKVDTFVDTRPNGTNNRTGSTNRKSVDRRT